MKLFFVYVFEKGLMTREEFSLPIMRMTLMVKISRKAEAMLPQVILVDIRTKSGMQNLFNCGQEHYKCVNEKSMVTLVV